MRFSEEVLLIREEMRRVLAYFVWHEEWWKKQDTRRDDADRPLAEGLKAYAFKQADMRRELRLSFNNMWRSSAEFCALGVGADSEILDLGLAQDYILGSRSEIDEVPLVFSSPSTPVALHTDLPHD